MPRQLFFRTTRHTCIALSLTLIAMLWAGLNTKNFRIQNDLIWRGGGLEFGQDGIAYTDTFLTPNLMDKLNRQGFVIELKLEPAPIGGDAVKFILEITAEETAKPLIVWQWRNNIIAMNGNDYPNTQKNPRVSTKLNSGINNIKLIIAERTLLQLENKTRDSIVNGALKLPVIPANSIETSQYTNSRIVVGNSAQRQNSWQGIINELTIYRLTNATESNKNAKENADLVRYIFRGQGGEQVQDQSGNNYPLYTPKQPIRLKRVTFDNQWGIFNSNWNATVDIIINCVGFIPLGFLFTNLMLNLKVKFYTGIPVVLIFGFLLSFAIEFIQSWIPSRYSAIEDLVLNFVGTGLGLIVFTVISKHSNSIVDKSPYQSEG
ncbi:MAG: VanZ family protein [Gammaproteobacteria bacterium]|nr:VanZ family protein [Gammaproteobacteria bacterium]